MNKFLITAILLSLLVLTGCDNKFPATSDEEENAEILPEARLINLVTDDSLFASQPEISGLTWYKDKLLLIPQFPHRLSPKHNGTIPYIEKDSIYAFLEGKTAKIEVDEFQLIAPGLEEYSNPGSGYESAVVRGNDIYFTIESVKGISTAGFIVKGEIDDKEKTITVISETLKEIKQVTSIFNFSDEAIVEHNNKLYTLYEANGRNVNPYPAAHIFSLNLDPLGAVPFPSTEYRITDATSADDSGKFWAVNYFYPGEAEKLNPAPDSVVIKYGTGESHLDSPVVERLLEYKILWDRIIPAGTKPIYLSLKGEEEGRNWEGIERLDDRGFIAVTDTYPTDRLVFFDPANVLFQKNSDN